MVRKERGRPGNGETIEESAELEWEVSSGGDNMQS